MAKTSTVLDKTKRSNLIAILSEKHGESRAIAVAEEAENSSNPEYILHYWGIKDPKKYINQYHAHRTSSTVHTTSGLMLE